MKCHQERKEAKRLREERERMARAERMMEKLLPTIPEAEVWNNLLSTTPLSQFQSERKIFPSEGICCQISLSLSFSLLLGKHLSLFSLSLLLTHTHSLSTFLLSIFPPPPPVEANPRSILDIDQFSQPFQLQHCQRYRQQSHIQRLSAAASATTA